MKSCTPSKNKSDTMGLTEIRALKQNLENQVKDSVHNNKLTFGERAKIIAESGFHPSKKHSMFNNLAKSTGIVKEGDVVYGNQKQIVGQLASDLCGRAYLIFVSDAVVEVREFDTNSARDSGYSPHGSKQKSDALRCGIKDNYNIVYRERLEL